MEKEIIISASHTQPHFKEDNSNVYYYTEEAASTMIYATSINPYHNNNNVRDTFLSLIAQYAGEDKWQKHLKDSAKILQNQR